MSMKRLSILVALMALGANSYAQTISDYIKTRQNLKIGQTVGVHTLQTMVGTRIIEISGTVKGSIRVGDGGTLMLQTDQGTIPVKAKVIPAFMVGSSVKARMIIQAVRAEAYSSLEATLVDSIAETSMQEWELKNKPKPTAKPSVRGSTSRSSGSRGNKPPIIQGDLPSRDGSQQPRATKPTAGEWNLTANDALPFYVDFIKGYNKRLSAATAEKIARGVIGYSLEYGVDARLIMAILITESGFNPNAKSRAGAKGLGQLMPGTARELGVSNSYDEMDNLYGTVKLVSQHLSKYNTQTGGNDFESIVLMLAAYNAGPGAVKRHGGVPPYRETQAYVRKITAIYKQLCGE